MAESSPYDTMEGLCPGCNPPAQAAANSRLPMTGHGSTTQTRSNAQLLPSTTRHVIPHRDKEAHAHKHRGEKRGKNTPVIFPKKVAGRFQNCCTDLRQNALVFEKFALLTVAHKGSRHQCLPRTHVLPPINDFTSFVCLAKGAGGESCSLEHRGSRGGSKRRDADVFCRCLLNFYESPGRTLTNQS